MVETQIRSYLQDNDVVLFMKGSPIFPQCGFSGKVVHILKEYGIPFKGVNVLEDPEMREGIKQFSHWPTLPQLYIKGEFMGGCDIVTELHQTGELRKVLKEKGIIEH